MVSKETKETILATIDEVFQKMNSISWIDRQKAMSKEAFKNTEKILYCFNVLKEHVSNEQEYDDYGQRKEVVPIKEVAGLELEEYKFRCLQEIMEANRTIIGAVRDSLESLQEAIATDVTENQIKIITDDLSEKGTIISKQLDALTSSLEKYKKESIDIKDYPNYL